MGKNLKGKDCGKGIYQRKDGLYSARFVDKAGKRHEKYFQTLPEARNWIEEAKYADYILHVVDASNPQMEQQMHIVYDTLYRLGIQGKTIVTLFNKQDRVTGGEPLRDFKADYTLGISAKEGMGLDALKELLCGLLRENKILVEQTISYEAAGVLQQIRKSGELLEEEYRPEGIFIRAYVPADLYGRL